MMVTDATRNWISLHRHRIRCDPDADSDTDPSENLPSKNVAHSSIVSSARYGPMTMLERLAQMLQGIVTALDGPGLFLVAILDSSFLSIPEGNDILIVILSIGATWGRMSYYVAMTTLGSILGCLALYTVGRKGGSPLLKRRFSPRPWPGGEAVRTIRHPDGSCAQHPAAANTFKIFVLSAGVFELPIWEFICAVASAGRFATRCGEFWRFSTARPSKNTCNRT